MAYFAVKRKIRLVAEGIETGKELEILRSLAIHYGQGYLLGRPQDGREAGPWPTVAAFGTTPMKARRSRRAAGTHGTPATDPVPGARRTRTPDGTKSVAQPRQHARDPEVNRGLRAAAPRSPRRSVTASLPSGMWHPARRAGNFERPELAVQQRWGDEMAAPELDPLAKDSGGAETRWANQTEGWPSRNRSR